MLEQNNIKMIACKNKIIPGIYITSTPLGNRYDITLRALHLFDKADVMLCEDTRTTKRLFKLLDISLKNKSWLSYNDHNSSNIFLKGQIILLNFFHFLLIFVLIQGFQ